MEVDMRNMIRESRAVSVTEADPAGRSGRLQIGLITPGWGSSGYYAAPVLEAAATAKVFPAGTQMFLDHETETEKTDRPERSVRDLAAVLTEDAVWDGQQLVGEAQVFGPYVEMLTDEHLAKSIGVSIRAYATGGMGEAEGRHGAIVGELTEAISVDFVTKAGRGGSILQVLESARPARVVESAIAHGVTESTANDTRESLQQTLRDTYHGTDVWLWVRDFDDTTVWYEHETPGSSGTFAEGYTINDQNAVTLAGSRVEVRARTEYVPVEATTPAAEAAHNVHPNVPAPAGQHHPTPTSEEDSMGTIQVDEAEHGRLTEAAGRVAQAEQAERAATQALAVYKAREAARPAVTKKVGESTLPTSRRARIVESVLQQVRVDENGAANAEQLVTITESEVKAAEVDMAEIAEALGLGKVRNFGATESVTGPTEDDFDAAFGVKTSREG